ncbi:VOC family protein, partial [Candidatus Aerophobetes bacterium]|nr:VOC family protein [Candidatus Aerophobetes bacterium]
IVEAQKVRTAFIPVGESKIELLESTDPEGVIAKYIEKRGEGLHHLALEVSDIQQALDTLREKGIQLIDERPRSGVKGTRIAFLHPKQTKVLIELVEPGE